VPATGVRFTMIFRDGSYGFSESHTLAAAGTIAAAKNPAIDLLKARMQLMATGVAVKTARLSKEGVRNDSRILGADIITPIKPPGLPVGDPSGAGLDSNTDQTKAAYQLRLESGDLHRSPLYLSGIPDYVIRYDANNNPIAPPPFWNEYLKLYIAELKKGWGYVGVSEAAGALAPRAVVRVATDMGTGLLQITTQAAGLPYTSGQVVTLRGFKLTNRAYNTPNGRWQISAVAVDTPVAGQVTYTLRNSSGVSVNTITLLGTVEPLDYTTYAYDNVERIGPTTRKRGNRSLLPPGKRLIRRRVSA
jgi:hypothetical protein